MSAGFQERASPEAAPARRGTNRRRELGRALPTGPALAVVEVRPVLEAHDPGEFISGMRGATPLGQPAP